jgi:anti-anti-sigma regulatory factor/anti-sigma regulatory factor (Ser/Thr protein kinase)
MQNQNWKTSWFRRRDNTIVINGKVNSYNVKDFCAAINLFKQTGRKELTIDFSNVTKAYPNGMLPIIATVQKLGVENIKIYIKLPNNDNTRRLFRAVNWAYYLSPSQFEKSESTHDRHLIATNFKTAIEQKKAVDDLMEVILRNMELPRDIISGLEWSINELTDNVLNHSQSNIGGFVQATTYPSEGIIAFAVADSGRGILNSLKEGYPTLRTDIQAMGEAIKLGVTRNPKDGQGNGLAGSLKVTNMSGGSFELTSGTGKLIITEQETQSQTRTNLQHYEGTLVCGQLKNKQDFSVSKALVFLNGNEYTPVDFIEIRYEMEDKDCLHLKMKEETTGFGTRHSGSQIRTKIVNLMNAEPTYPIIIDWEGVPVISSSFADEVIGKLFLRLGAMTFSSKIRNVNMEALICGLLDKAVAQRLTQEKDEM